MGACTNFDVYAGEVIGTFFLVFSVSLIRDLGDPATAPLAVFFVLTALIFALGFVSGSQFNPAVTLSIFLSGRNLMRCHHLMKYIVSQVIGSVLGGLLSWVCVGKISTLRPGAETNMREIATVEVVFSALLCFVTLSVATTETQKDNHYFGLAVAAVMGASVLIAGPITGGLLNPAAFLGLNGVNWLVSLAGLTSETFQQELIWAACYVGLPFMGAFIAAGLFRISRPQEFGQQPLADPLQGLITPQSQQQTQDAQ
uniref:Aquaporin n=1 Tax=Chromera velia CCMP2878 TaxID=1169474 RepID=A0A0G4H7B0_9ALVE|mmetsp:Transcript_43013/g.84802  ORF Transcript_43013/g.84802 Transcript_43013/m.84802 type:complete len:256 (+) Transcript_43013:378-1145(+)|eukprot:Cvel_25008.t1-p1 / transcript=Cvel_25008.t1 / gene=Cvel_25008 / organism=Chromera_velia_CCMP2878 / gene_product=Aquaporin NIP1-2, putative / transcript_product=Aquaporin NIP1-2, putative / location=Cvel_scaffold2772:13584-17397(-) / protein_length=255 / sequence_SO=supercontig / SO=protein_coding / is_pseudo=false